MQYKDGHADVVHRSLAILRAGLRVPEIQKFEVTFMLAILQNFLLIANQQHRDLLSNEKIMSFAQIQGSGSSKIPNLVRRLRNSVAHTSLGFTTSEGSIAAVEFQDTDRGGSLRIEAKELRHFTEMLGAYLLGFIEKDLPIGKRRKTSQEQSK
jgi:hypothetical protein